MKNDDKILELQSQIAKKKEEHKNKNKKFSPATNCVIELDGVKYNLQVLGREQITILLIKLNLYQMSIKDLKLDEIIMISGFTLEDWITDIKNKIEAIKYKEEESKLKDMENKLNKLLSDEKKTELEIDEIAALLN